MGVCRPWCMSKPEDNFVLPILNRSILAGIPGLNLSSHACVANTLHTESSPQPNKLFKLYFIIIVCVFCLHLYVCIPHVFSDTEARRHQIWNWRYRLL